jgi:SAM-dependent methyltransferase
MPTPTRKSLADWQLPNGVSRGTWDYSQHAQIAVEYDQYHQNHPLLAFDQQVVKALFPASSDNATIVDLGCGTGRSIIPLAERGYRVVGVDLSECMLDEVRRKSGHVSDRVKTVAANLIELDFLADQSVAGILCLFSSFGMVRGRKNRQQALEHVARILTPDGRLLLHVHNRGSWWRDPNGTRYWLRSLWKSTRRRDFEMGDRVYSYRGVPNFFLHIFSRAELQRDLADAGLVTNTWQWLDRHSAGELKTPWWLPQLRAGGMLVTIGKR